MKRVRVITGYKDMQLNRQVGAGEMLDVSDERAQALISHDPQVAELVEDATFREPEIVPETPVNLEPPQKTEEGLKAPEEVITPETPVNDHAEITPEADQKGAESPKKKEVKAEDNVSKSKPITKARKRFGRNKKD